jgi:hypothetical protein
VAMSRHAGRRDHVVVLDHRQGTGDSPLVGPPELPACPHTTVNRRTRTRS